MRRVLWTILVLSSLLYVGCSSSTDSSVEAPSITSDLESTIKVTEGATAVLFIDANGDDISYKWQQVTLNEQSVVIGILNLENETNDTLSILVTAEKDKASYRCIVSNEGGADTSKVATIVIDQPEVPVIKTDLSNFSGIDGVPFVLTVSALGQNLSYAWQQVILDVNGTITSALPIEGATSASYSGTISATTDGTSYRCIVSNTTGSDTSAVATVTMLKLPVITTDIENITAIDATPFTLTPVVSGENLTFTWQEVTLDAQGIIVTTTELEGVNTTALSGTVSTETNGKSYRCIIGNDAGSDTTAIATITMITQPVISTDLSNAVAFDNTPFSLLVAANGMNLTYAWQQVTLDINGAVLGATPIANEITASYSGTVSVTTNGTSYRCIVSNEAGSDTSSVATITMIPYTIDLTSFAVVGATSSRPAIIKTIGDKLYVGLQRLDENWQPVESSIVLVIDGNTNTITDTITCAGKNVGDMEVVGDYLYVVNTGSMYATNDGMVERISLVDHSIETVYTGTADITDIEHYSGDQFFVATYSFDATTFKGSAPVYLCDFSTDTFIEIVTGVENGKALLYDSESAILFIGEASGTSKSEVKVYNTVTKTVTSIPTSLGISSMTFYGTGTDKRILLTETDYTSGHLGEIKNGVYSKKLDINSDSYIVTVGTDIFVLERSGADNLMKISPSYAVEYQNALTDSYNPYALTIVNGIGYLLSYEFATLNTFTVSTGILK